MNDRPIDIPASRIPALLDGRMTQYRVPLKPQPDPDWPIGGAEFVVTPDGADRWCWLNGWDGSIIAPFDAPHVIGDRLWVREAFRAEELSLPPIRRKATARERRELERTYVEVFRDLDGADGIRYLADDHWQIIENSPEAGEAWSEVYWRGEGGRRGIGEAQPSITMPRWASRITLTVTDLAVHRVQDISEADAIAEGCEPEQVCCGNPDVTQIGPEDFEQHCCGNPVLGPPDFPTLYNTTHGEGAWERNDWVLATTFRVDLCNIDQMEEANG